MESVWGTYEYVLIEILHWLSTFRTLSVVRKGSYSQPRMLLEQLLRVLVLHIRSILLLFQSPSFLLLLPSPSLEFLADYHLVGWMRKEKEEEDGWICFLLLL